LGGITTGDHYSVGEIYICLSIAKKDAKKFEMSYNKFLHLLVIHGVLHLKGHAHGSTMEELEDSYVQKFYTIKQK
jgi:rRNA maturation RNase YbeY